MNLTTQLIKWSTHGLAAFLMGLAILCMTPDSGKAAQFPELPYVYIDTIYSPPSGNTIVVKAGGDFQAALNNAALGDTIVLEAGATFNGPFYLPNKTSGSGWIYIQSSAYGSLPPPETRVSPLNASNMPTIVAGASASAIATASNAHHYRFVGIEFRPPLGQFIYNLILIGNGESNAGALPNNITFDRCYIHGDPSAGGRRGIAMNGNGIAVIDSYLADFKEKGADSQTLMAWNSAGPIKIANNYLEAAGENVMFGGAEPSVTNLVPADIFIKQNHFFKKLSWMGSSWQIKNLLELKNAKRVLVTGNVFQNNWQAAQNGFSILLTPRNEYGGCPGCGVQDVVIRQNRMLNLGQGINIAGRDNNYSSQVTKRVLIEHNEIQITGLGSSGSRIWQILSGPTNVTIRNNTGIITTAAGATGFTESSPKADAFIFQNNLMSKGVYGWAGTGTGEGTATLDTYYTNYTFTYNAIIGSSGTYPNGNFYPANVSAVGFVDFSGGNYRLSASSPFKGKGSDGKDLGADIDALNAAISGAGVPPPRNLRVVQ